MKSTDHRCFLSCQAPIPSATATRAPNAALRAKLDSDGLALWTVDLVLGSTEKRDLDFCNYSQSFKIFPPNGICSIWIILYATEILQSILIIEIPFFSSSENILEHMALCFSSCFSFSFLHISTRLVIFSFIGPEISRRHSAFSHNFESSANLRSLTRTSPLNGGVRKAIC